MRGCLQEIIVYKTPVTELKRMLHPQKRDVHTVIHRMKTILMCNIIDLISVLCGTFYFVFLGNHELMRISVISVVCILSIPAPIRITIHVLLIILLTIKYNTPLIRSR